LKCFCWLFIHFTSILQVQCLCIYCTKTEKIRISDLSPTNTIRQYYCMFMLKYQNALSAMKTHCFSFMLGLSRAVNIISLKSASKQRNKITNHRHKYYCGIKVLRTDFNIEHFMNHCYIYSTYITNSFTK
jgi:hypothetical protein